MNTIPDIQLIEIRPYEASLRSAWDDVVRNSRNGTFLHSRDFLEYHEDRFVEQSFVLFKAGKAIAVFPATLIEATLVSHQGLTFGGLIYKFDMHATDVIEIFDLILEYCKSRNIRKIIYKPVPHLFHSYCADDDLYALFRQNAILIRRDLSSAVIFENRPKMSSLRRRMIKKGNQTGLTIMTDGFYDEFHHLLEAVLQRHSATPVHSVEEMRLLADRFPANISLHGAFDGRELCAGVWLFDFGHVLHTQYLASSEHGRACGALDFLLAHIIDQYSPLKRALSFGTSTEKAGRYLNEGLLLQKEGVGARSISLDCYEIAL